MRICLDGRMFAEAGIGRYIRNLISELQELDKDNEYFILHLRNHYDTLEYHNNFKKILADFRWYSVTEQLKLPKILKQLNPDLVHFPHFNVPVFYKQKFVVTIHDLIHQHYQMRRATTHDPITYRIKQMGYKTVFRNAVSNSAKILVPSNYVKSLLIREWRINESKVVVTAEAVDDKILTFVSNLSMQKSRKILDKLGIKPPYIFYVGNAHPHKNVEGLIKAFLKLKEKYSGLTLVLSGYDHYFWQRLKKENQHPGVVFAGYVADEELVALYKNAKCFIIPSFEEGFGIPLLEAFACSCPVISSNAGALPEVGGGSAIYFDPHDTEAMVEKIKIVLNNGKIRAELIEKGQKRVKMFSWEKLARKTLEVYSQCV